MKNKKSILFIMILVSFFAVAKDSFAETFYVNPNNGNDSNTGTISAPFKTIEKARDTIRTINSNMQEDITVYLRGGWYDLDKTIQFTSLDSGSNGKNIIYRNYPGEIAVISGGKKITGWELHDSKKNIWKANVSGVISDTRHLYVDYVRATRARTESGTIGAYQLTKRADLGGYTTTNTNMKNWANKQNIEFVSNEQWKQFRCGVSNIAGNTITIKKKCWDDSQSHKDGVQDFTMKSITRIENAYELLDTPGEWYLDKKTKWIYYIPKSGKDMNSAVVIASNLETLVNGSGVSGNKLHNIQFQGLRFAYSGWTGPNGDGGFPEIQANYHGKINSPGTNGCDPENTFCRKTPASVVFSNAENIKFEGNRFVHLGAAGLSFGPGSNNNLVSGNVFTDISGNGLVIGDVGVRNDTRPQNNTISNNYIHNVAVEYQGGVGIFVGYTKNTLIKNNELHDLPYNGISIGHFLADYRYVRGNKIENNRIYDHMKVLYDGGGIYSMGPQFGSVYSGNVITGQVNEFGGIYLDSYSRFIELHHNVVTNNQRTALIKTDKNGCGDYKIHDNYWSTRSSVPVKHSRTVLRPDVWYEKKDYTYNKCTLIQSNNNAISSLNEAPAQILNNAGLTNAYKYLKGSDVTGPTVTINSKPPLSTNQTTARFTFSSNEPSEFLCSLNGAPFEVCVSPKVYGNLSANKYTFSVKAVDRWGNVGASTASNKYTWGIKIAASSTPPVVKNPPCGFSDTVVSETCYGIVPAPITKPIPTPIIIPAPTPTPLPAPIITPVPLKIDGSLGITDKYSTSNIAPVGIPVSSSSSGDQTTLTTGSPLPAPSTALVSNSLTFAK